VHRPRSSGRPDDFLNFLLVQAGEEGVKPNGHGDSPRGNRLNRPQSLSGCWCPGFQFGGKLAVQGGKGETHHRPHPLQQIEIPDDEVGLGDDLNRETRLGEGL